MKTIPTNNTILRRVFDSLHAQWHSPTCAKEFPLCEEWVKTWLDGHEFTAEDIELAVIETFDAVYERGDDIPFPELDLGDEGVLLSTISSVTPISGISGGPRRLRMGRIVGFQAVGRRVLIEMDPGDEFSGESLHSSTTRNPRRVQMLVEEA